MVSDPAGGGHAAAPAPPTDWGGHRGADGLPAVPIVLGVVGHRKLAPGHGEALRARLTEIFRGFLDAYPTTPLIVLTSLAEGADQLAAGAALEAGAWVRAPLPFAPAIYRDSTSFDDDGARRGLDGFLGDPRVDWFVVPLPDGTTPGEGDAAGQPDWHRVATDRDDPAATERRHLLYANSGGYIVQHCHALIALWDGAPNGRSGGTSELVAFKLHGRAPRDFPKEQASPLGFRAERGLVLAVETPRPPEGGADPAPPAAPGGLRVLVPDHGDDRSPAHPPDGEPAASSDPPRLPKYLSRPARLLGRSKAPVLGLFSIEHRATPAECVRDELRQFRETCSAIEDFNRDVGLSGVKAALASPSKDVTELGGFASDGRHDRWLVRLSRLRDAAGAVSRTLQPAIDRALVGVFVLIGLGILALHIYGHEGEQVEGGGHPVHRPEALMAFVVLLAAAVLIILVNRMRLLEQRRLDSRALAEALRVRRAWALAGVGRSVAETYLGQLRGEMSWMRRAVMQVSPPPALWAARFASLPPDRQRERIEYVLRYWVGEASPGREPERRSQLYQYRTAHRREHRRATRLRMLGLVAALLGWGMMAGLLLRYEWAAQPPGWYLLLASTLVVAGGLAVAYCERRSHEELSNQYERMEIVFDNGSRAIRACLADGDLPGARHVIEELGREAIAEHSQWLVLRRSRPLELPLH